MSTHDKGYKNLFSHPRMVRDLLVGYVKEDWVDDLDFGTLEKVSGSYVSDDLRERTDDAIWKVKWRGRDKWLYVYVLLEFQSTVDHFMALRVMTYVGLLYQDLIKRKSVHEALRALYIMLRWLRSPGAQQDSLRRAITVWFNQVQKPAKLLDENAPPPANKQEMESMIIDKMQRWQEELRNEGREEGREEGHEEGKALGAVTLFEKQLTLKFGPIDEATLAKIKSAPIEELQPWAENILTATTLNDVFKK